MRTPPRLKPTAYVFIVLLLGALEVSNYFLLQPAQSKSITNANRPAPAELLQVNQEMPLCFRPELSWLDPFLGFGHANGCAVYLVCAPLVVGILMLLILPHLVAEKRSEQGSL